MSERRTPQEIISDAFPGIGAAEANELIATSQLKTYPVNTVLCRENELEDTFYLLLNGAVNVTKTINNMERRLLKQLDEGSFFGEMALIHNAPRAASVTARTEVTVMEIRKEDFNRVLQRSGSVALAMVREISSRLRANDEMAIEDLRLRASELSRAYQRLAEQELARREFLTSIAHELRTPLMAAGGFLSLLQKGMVPEKDVPNTIDTVSRNIQQITTLVNDILFLQEMDLILPKFQSVNMVAIADAVIAKYTEKAAEKGLQLYREGPNELPSVSGDPKSLERALTALVDNAIKFSGEGKSVVVRQELSGGHLLTHVVDQGVGIDPDILPRIFDRFYHMDKAGSSEQLFGGVGLGLSITRQVIQQHNGELSVESALNKGSTFTMRLNIMRVII